MSEIPPVVPPVTPPATWYAGLDAEHVGHVQSRGWDKLDPTAAALEAVKAHRSAAVMIGTPADQILKLPKDASDEAGWKSTWQRLGAPDKPEGYKFEGIDNPAFTDKMREAAAKLNVPVAMAEAMAKAAFEHNVGVTAAKVAETSALQAAELAKLAENWGAPGTTRFETNKFVADRTMERLGVTKDVAAKMTEGMGGAAVSELFRTIGVGMGEDTFVRDPGPGGRDMMTRDQAVARQAELERDPAWRGRYLAGGAPERRELNALQVLQLTE